MTERMSWNDAKGADSATFTSSVVSQYGVRTIVSIEETQDALAELALAVQAAEDELALGVGAAKLAGASWAQIGEALDMTKQAACKRFSVPAAQIIEADERERVRIFGLLRIGVRHVSYEIRVGNRHGARLSRHRDERVALRHYEDRLERWEAAGRTERMPRCYKVTPGEGRNVKIRLLDLAALRQLGMKRAARIVESGPQEEGNAHTRGWFDDDEEVF